MRMVPVNKRKRNMIPTLLVVMNAIVAVLVWQLNPTSPSQPFSPLSTGAMSSG